MGCGCGKNKKKNLKSSRMPSSSEPLKKIGNIPIPKNMTPNQRRSTVAKINNDKLTSKNKNPKNIRKRMNIADRAVLDKIRKSRECGD